LSLATLTYNLTVLFQRHLGWQQKVTIHSLRFWLFMTAESSVIRPGKPPSSWPCRTGKETGGDGFGRKSLARFPIAMQ